MTPNTIFTKFLPAAAAMAAVGAFAGCSTVKSISPFQSNVPYSQDIQPTMAKPAVTEIPAFKPKPPPPPAPPKPAPAPEPSAPPPAQEPAAAAPAPAAPSPAPAAPAPAPAAPSPAAPQSSALPAPAQAPKIAEAQPPAVQSDSAIPASKSASEATAADSGEPDVATEAGKRPPPSISEERRVFKDDGNYPNLAQVPARPVNLPTFAEAKTIEKSLVADRAKAQDARPESPDAPPVDSVPVPVSQLKPVAVASAAPAVPEAATRLEDRSPCLGERPINSKPTAVLHFDTGSAAMTADSLAKLVEALPSIRAATGTIRIFGHGDTEPNAAIGAGRFDLAAARAGAVAQAVAGYGIPVPRIAVGVACTDAAFAGASVQLYAES